MNDSEQERLQARIEERRGELGETVEALVYKVDIPARTKDRVDEMREDAAELAGELREQAVERAGELREQAVERAGELREQAVQRAVEVAERAREAASRTSAKQWATLAGAGVGLIALMIIMQRARR